MCPSHRETRQKTVHTLVQQFSAVVVHIATFVVCDMGQYRTNLMGAVVIVFDLMITELWPCSVGVLEWCQVTAAAAA